MELISLLFDNTGMFLLVFARVVGMFASAPIFSQNNIPVYVKVGLSFLLAIVIFPVLPISEDIVLDGFFQLLFFIFKEVLIGVIIGFICYLFFSIVYLAGHAIDMEIGFSMASVINPLDDTEIPLTANFIFVLGTLIFLTINGHHQLIYALKQSFDIVPIGELGINDLMLDQLIGILVIIFVIAFKMSAPIMVSIFLSNVLLGILARTMPQMNVFVVGMPLKILVGTLIIFIVLPLYLGFFEYIFDTMFVYLMDFITSIAKG